MTRRPLRSAGVLLAVLLAMLMAKPAHSLPSPASLGQLQQQSQERLVQGQVGGGRLIQGQVGGGGRDSSRDRWVRIAWRQWLFGDGWPARRT